MLFPVPTNFKEALTPLIYFNWITGIGAFRSPNQSGTRYNFMKFYTVSHLLVTWIATYVTFGFIAEMRPSAGGRGSMALTMFKTLFYVNGAVNVATPFLIWLRKEGVRDCMQQIAILEHTYRSVLGAPNEHREQYIHLTCQVMVIWLFITVVTIYDSVFSQWIKFQLSGVSYLEACCVILVLHQPIGTMLVLSVNFCTLARYLERKFRYLNDSLLRLADKPSTHFPDERLFVISKNAVETISGNRVENTEAGSLMNEKDYLLREIRKAHLKLCKLSGKINLVFGIQNLISAGISFVMITGLLYTIYSVLSRKSLTVDNFKELLPPVLWIAIYACKIWMINHTCWSVGNEAERTGEVLYELLNPKVDKKLQEEVKEFGIQRLQNPVRFNACGFFTLDYTFVQGVIGSITTYLIILIQLNPASEGPNRLSPGMAPKFDQIDVHE